MAFTENEQLRQLLGETIPEGGTDADTLFTDDEIQSYLDATSSVDRAAYEGWRVKAARLSNLVDVTEGNASRKMSDLHAQAMSMVRQFERATAGPTEGRTRIGRIRRR